MIDGVEVQPRNFQTIEEGNLSSNRSDPAQKQQEPVMNMNVIGNPPMANVFQQHGNLGQLVSPPMMPEQQQLMSPGFPEYAPAHQQPVPQNV